jgi:mannose-6-phosphate isomerase-like protein (cupin superfamily)
MQPFVGYLEALATQHDDFRHVLFTGMHEQVVAMALQPGEDIGSERHEVDQVFMLVQGTLAFDLDAHRYELAEGGILVVPAGTQHNVINVGPEKARLITIYAPAQHPAGTVHHTKADAVRGELLAHA